MARSGLVADIRASASRPEPEPNPVRPPRAHSRPAPVSADLPDSPPIVEILILLSMRPKLACPWGIFEFALHHATTSAISGEAT